MKRMIALGIIASLFGCISGSRVTSDDTIVSFSYSKDGGMRYDAGFSYSVNKTGDGKAHFVFDKNLPGEKEFTIDDLSVFDSLQKIILKHRMYRYSGYYRPRARIMDGKTWYFDVEFASGKTIDAHGYMRGPRGYGKAFDEVVACFDEWKKLPGDIKDIVSFQYIYGMEEYCLQRKEDCTQVTYDNHETNEHSVIEKDLEMLDDLRVFCIVRKLRKNGSYRPEEENIIPWSYEIHYSNGEHYLYQSFDRDYPCGNTHDIQGFISRWLKESK